MHLPDAFLDAKTVVLTTTAASVGVGFAVRHLQSTTPPKQVPMLGLAGAFIFAAQMLNFPVPGGTSGHLIGGVLAAVLLGPSAAVLVITCVLIVQCLMFADGGLLALGANVFNMSIVSVCGGFFAFRVVKKLFPMDALRGTVFAAAFAGWFGTVLGSITCAGQLALSGTAPWGLTFPAMANIHMLIGIGEGLATGLITFTVLRNQPGFAPAVTSGAERKPLLVFGSLIAFGMALFVAPFASPWPDGLEAVAEKLGFAGAESHPLIPAPMPDYSFPLIGSATFGTAIAGVVGTAIAFAAAYIFARVLVRPIGMPKADAPNS